MDIAGVSTALANVNLQTKVGTAVLGKALDTSRDMGARLVDMIDSAAMERSVNPAVGAYFDMRV